MKKKTSLLSLLRSFNLPSWAQRYLRRPKKVFEAEYREYVVGTQYPVDCSFLPKFKKIEASSREEAEEIALRGQVEGPFGGIALMSLEEIASNVVTMSSQRQVEIVANVAMMPSQRQESGPKAQKYLRRPKKVFKAEYRDYVVGTQNPVGCSFLPKFKKIEASSREEAGEIALRGQVEGPFGGIALMSLEEIASNVVTMSSQRQESPESWVKPNKGT